MIRSVLPVYVLALVLLDACSGGGITGAAATCPGITGSADRAGALPVPAMSASDATVRRGQALCKDIRVTYAGM